eukprot:CAMPEP_0184489104 /NCGR_PEP_ID=MMETSP0113_2-20130426/14410_1 /TAXON_ID=91329 /ORGANISM="Norrisiella sphaerica, Strain BC52" /LENGTH=159 /DNA_ID=CAMNT_0026872327 /DNA_START=424 /DNA_END=900 /DNA_ORIENTATION=-
MSLGTRHSSSDPISSASVNELSRAPPPPISPSSTIGSFISSPPDKSSPFASAKLPGWPGLSPCPGAWGSSVALNRFSKGSSSEKPQGTHRTSRWTSGESVRPTKMPAAHPTAVLLVATVVAAVAMQMVTFQLLSISAWSFCAAATREETRLLRRFPALV